MQSGALTAGDLSSHQRVCTLNPSSEPLDRPDPLSPTGGLLICLPREQAARFCAEIKSPKYGEGHQAWIIGIVEKGNRTARIIDKPRIIEVAPQAATQNVNPTPGATS